MGDQDTEQGYNAQAAVDVETMLIVATTVTQHSNGKRQIAPMVGVLGALPEQLGQPEVLLADAGYFSAANVTRLRGSGTHPADRDPARRSSSAFDGTLRRRSGAG